MGFLARLARSTLAVMAFAAAGVVDAAWAPMPLPTPTPVASPDGFEIRASRLAGLPGETVAVEFDTDEIEGGPRVRDCQAFFADRPDPPKRCEVGASKIDTATLEVPNLAPGRVKVVWELWKEDPPVVQYSSPTPAPDESAPPLTASFEFTVLAIDVTTTPEAAEPGKPVTVTLTGRPAGMRITSCTIGIDLTKVDCAKNQPSAEILVPSAAQPGSDVKLTWHFTYQYGDDQGNGDGSGSLPVALPPPEFQVLPANEAKPGVPFAVTFSSLTPGVAVAGCDITLRIKAACSRSGVAVVLIPPRTQPGTTITIPWNLTYTSTRRDETPVPRSGALSVEVVAVPPRFIVSVQPDEAEPRQEVTVTLTPTDPATITVAGCQAFFPRGDTAFCQRSTGRWFARVRVPADAPPGDTLVRWGATSLIAGEIAADDDVIPFRVLAPKDNPPTESPPTTTPPRTTPVTPPDTTTPSTSDPTPTPTQTTADPPPPMFVAVADPEGADPGQPVSVTIQPLTSGTTITGCRAAFDGTEAAACRPAGGNWTARVTVPDDAAPGDLPLQWDVTDSGGQGGGGTINYRVLGSDGPSIQPQAGVTLHPTEGKPGGMVKVTPHVDDETVTITGCRAAYLPDGKIAECHNAGRGWVADVTLPEDAPAGNGTLFWQVAYARSGENDSADGNVTIPVVADPRSWWSKVAGVLWPRGAAVFGLATALAVAAFQGWRKRQRGTRTDRDEPATGFSVDVIRRHGAAAATIEDTPPRLVVRLTLHPGTPRIRCEELR